MVCVLAELLPLGCVEGALAWGNAWRPWELC